MIRKKYLIVIIISAMFLSGCTIDFTDKTSLLLKEKDKKILELNKEYSFIGNVDVEKKCNEDAKLYFYKDSGLLEVSKITKEQVDFVSYYNYKKNKCFVLTSSIDSDFYSSMVLSDTSGSIYGLFYGYMCYSDETKCKGNKGFIWYNGNGLNTNASESLGYVNSDFGNINTRNEFMLKIKTIISSQ